MTKRIFHIRAQADELVVAQDEDEAAEIFTKYVREILVHGSTSLDINEIHVLPEAYSRGYIP